MLFSFPKKNCMLFLSFFFPFFSSFLMVFFFAFSFQSCKVTTTNLKQVLKHSAFWILLHAVLVVVFQQKYVFKLVNDNFYSFCSRTVWKILNDWFAILAWHHQTLIKWDSSKEGNIEHCSKCFSSPTRWMENFSCCLAMRTNKTWHVFNHSDYGYVAFQAEIDLPSDINTRNVLWGCNNDCTVNSHILKFKKK